MTAILNEDPPAVSQVGSSISPGLQKIVNRCLAKSPDQRFQHASDLAFALEALSDPSGIATSAVPVSGASSSRSVWIAAVAALVVIAAALLWWTRPPAAPVVEAITQLTDDAKGKSNLQTDGARIYFNEEPSVLGIMQVSVTGGAVAPVQAPSRQQLSQVLHPTVPLSWFCRGPRQCPGRSGSFHCPRASRAGWGTSTLMRPAWHPTAVLSFPVSRIYS